MEMLNRINNKVKLTYYRLKDYWSKIRESVYITISSIILFVLLITGASTVASNIRDRHESEQTFRVELIESLRSIQSEISKHDFNVVFNGIMTKLGSIENKLDRLNETIQIGSDSIVKLGISVDASRGHIESVTGTLIDRYIKISNQRDSASMIPKNARTAILEPMLRPVIDSRVIDSLKLQLNARDNVITDLTRALNDSNKQVVMQKTRKHIFQGIGIGEAVYIGFKTVQAIK